MADDPYFVSVDHQGNCRVMCRGFPVSEWSLSEDETRQWRDRLNEAYAKGIAEGMRRVNAQWRASQRSSGATA